jgi:hypothetical protein
MCVIKETNPFELNPLIDPILLKYSITNFIDMAGPHILGQAVK